MNWKLAELVFFLAIAAALAAMMIAFWIRTWIEEAARDWHQGKLTYDVWREQNPTAAPPLQWALRYNITPWYVHRADRWAALRAKRLAR